MTKANKLRKSLQMVPKSKRPDATKAANRLLNSGYTIRKIDRYTGWGLGIRYWTELTKQNEPSRILPLARPFFFDNNRRLGVLRAFRVRRERELRLVSMKKTRRKGKLKSAGPKKGKSTKPDKHNSTASKEQLSPGDNRDELDALVKRYKLSGYIVVKVCWKEDDKSPCPYETSFALRCEPEPKYKLSLPYNAFKCGHVQRNQLIESLVIKRKKLVRISELKRHCTSTTAREDPASTIAPDCDADRVVVIVNNEKKVKGKELIAPNKVEVQENQLDTTREATSNTNDKQVRNIGVQVRPSYLEPRDHDKTREPNERKERHHKHMREFATQTNRADITWETITIDD